MTLSRFLTPWRRRSDPSPHADPGEPERGPNRWLPPWWLLLLPVLVAVSMGAVATWPLWRPDPSARMGLVPHDCSIAVLPLSPVRPVEALAAAPANGTAEQEAH